MICLICGNQCDNDAPEEKWQEHFAPLGPDQGWRCRRCNNTVSQEEAWYFSLTEFREDVEALGLEYT